MKIIELAVYKKLEADADCLTDYYRTVIIDQHLEIIQLDYGVDDTSYYVCVSALDVNVCDLDAEAIKTHEIYLVIEYKNFNDAVNECANIAIMRNDCKEIEEFCDRIEAYMS